MVIKALVAVPEPLIAIGNQLGAAIGASAKDAETFTTANWTDASGNRYAVAAPSITVETYEGAQGIVIGRKRENYVRFNTSPAVPDAICVIRLDDTTPAGVLAGIAKMGLVRPVEVES